MTIPFTCNHIDKKSLTYDQKLSEEVHILQNKIVETVETEGKADRRELELQHEINNVRDLLNKSKFTMDRFKHSKLQFKFYTGFESYELFKAVLIYLEPAAHSLVYWGSNTNIQTEGKKVRR